MVDLSKYLEQAADAVKRRNFAMAVKIYGQVLSIQPDFGDARSGLRKALFQKAAQKAPSKLAAMLRIASGVALCGSSPLIVRSRPSTPTFSPVRARADRALTTRSERSSAIGS